MKENNPLVEMWNSRFAVADYVYGTEPNVFFKEQITDLPPGKLLLPGDGEGRNGVYAASLGWDVDCVDWSEEARVKALKLAKQRNVLVNYIISDLLFFNPENSTYDAIGLIFLHLEESLREELHQKVIRALKPGGKVILEAYEKEQLKYGTGGPKDSSLLYSLEDIVNDFISLDMKVLSKEKIMLSEGELHKGESVVIRFVGVKPE